MKVVLRNDVDGVGRRGDIVDVAGGFPRNYALAGGQAMVATEGVTGQASAMRRARDLREAKDRGSAQAQAQALAGASLRLEARAGSTGKLFVSITAADVAEAVTAQKGGGLDRHQVVLDEPIKDVGPSEVPVPLFADIAPAVIVEVVAAS